MSWLAIAFYDADPVVIPLDDLRPHERATQCWCDPTYDDGVWVHHAMDRREDYEDGKTLS